jgi:hypothetical protein
LAGQSPSNGGGDRYGSTDDVDDQFRALLEGLRTTIPGVMVLFAFLLTLPLFASFSQLRGLDKTVFYIAFACATLSAVLLIAASVHQRVRAPLSGIRRRTMSHVLFATKLAIVGTITFAFSIAAVVYLVSTLVFADLPAAIATTVVTLITAWAWFYVPLVKFRHME